MRCTLADRHHVVIAVAAPVAIVILAVALMIAPLFLLITIQFALFLG